MKKIQKMKQRTGEILGDIKGKQHFCVKSQSVRRNIFANLLENNLKSIICLKIVWIQEKIEMNHGCFRFRGYTYPKDVARKLKSQIQIRKRAHQRVDQAYHLIFYFCICENNNYFDVHCCLHSVPFPADSKKETVRESG